MAESTPPPAATLDLAALLAEAEVLNPEIRAARARSEASRHVPSQVETLPDPLVAVSYTNETLDRFTLGDSPDSVAAVSWQQEMPWRGRRRLAGEVARAEVTLAEREADAIRTRVLSEVKRRYAALHRIDRSALILDESRRLLESLLQAARARYESGEGVLENVLKAQTEMTRLEADRALLDGERGVEAAGLDALLGRETAGGRGAARAPLRIEPLEAEALEEAAVERSPELAIRLATTARGERRVEQARADVKPDWMWEASYQNRGGLDPMVMGLVGVRLPLWKDRKQYQAAEQAKQELEAARLDAAAVRVRVRAEVRAALARAEQARLQRQLIEEGVLPQSRSALDSATAAYAAGRADFLTVVDDFLSLLRAEQEAETRREDEVAAAVRIELLTGLTLVAPSAAEPGAVPPGGSPRGSIAPAESVLSAAANPAEGGRP